MKTPKPKTLYRLFVTRFHSPSKIIARTFEKKVHKSWERNTRYQREQISMDREFTDAKEAKAWVKEQKTTTDERGYPIDKDDARYQWCELWGDPVPVSDTAKCERVRLEFEKYEEVPLFSEEQDAQIRSESLRALHA